MNKLDTIKRLLENSDIVWSKYGSDTIQGLAERILNALGETTIDHEESLATGQWTYRESITTDPSALDDHCSVVFEELQKLERLGWHRI
jgi:hypothetical protein